MKNRTKLQSFKIKKMTLKIKKTKGTNLQLNPQIVKDQLQLYYDVNNGNSYTSGTTLTNMAPSRFSNGVNGTLDNSSMVQTPTDKHPYIQLKLMMVQI